MKQITFTLTILSLILISTISVQAEVAAPPFPPKNFCYDVCDCQTLCYHRIPVCHHHRCECHEHPKYYPIPTCPGKKI
ncbi:hypothetical protein DCAR_0309877 [Daucus carota subsp. sativus]|uniref:Uncharacterized protein n=1 Tax=Daucus carota subsp. sativus TaxID=79200 RepID=A0A165ZFV4_DAUCS|nr:hypothetical protein DCAR_0309877 [Daucus carota subsp. sativus]